MQRLRTLWALTLVVLASGCAATSTVGSAAGSGANLMSSTSVGPRMGSLQVPASSSSPASVASADQPSLSCGALGLRIDALPVGVHVEHTNQDALRVAAAAHVGPATHVRTYVAWVQDPTADKVGLGDGARFRVMWVLDGTDIAAVPHQDEPHAAPPMASPGTAYRTLTLIDDQTMKLGGNFACDSGSAASMGSAGPVQGLTGPSSQPASTLGELSSAQRALALQIARNEAWTSQPSSPGLTPPGADPNAWPTNVDQVSAIVTAHAAAMQFVGGGTAAYETSLPVLVIRLVGNFSWVTSGPPGHTNATGTVATIVVNATTGQVTDTGLEDAQKPELPNASVLYTRTPESSATN
jgi:hypothetical protein